MKDILLTEGNGSYMRPEADSVITDSVRQAIRIRLKWFLNECELFEDGTGVPWFEDILVKNPNLDLIKTELREQIKSVTEVEDVQELDIVIDSKMRTALIKYTAITAEETIREEVDICQILTE